MRPTVLLAAIVVLVGGCITPSIPIPPPDPSEMDFTVGSGSDATASLVYPPDSNYAGGIVYVSDRLTMHGISQPVNPDDSIGPTDPVRAQLGDEVDVTIQTDVETVSSCVVLQQGYQDPDVYCTY